MCTAGEWDRAGVYGWRVGLGLLCRLEGGVRRVGVYSWRVG